MATAPSTAEQRETRDQEKGGKSQIVIVDFGERNPPSRFGAFARAGESW